jgi:hypothetical protein
MNPTEITHAAIARRLTWLAAWLTAALVARLTLGELAERLVFFAVGVLAIWRGRVWELVSRRWE